MRKPIREWADTYLWQKLAYVRKNLEAGRIAIERCRNGIPGYGHMADLVADETQDLQTLEAIRDEVERRHSSQESR